MMGTRRFSAFQKNLGVAKNILTVRLRTLVAQGILEVQPAADGSAYQDYVLTPKGRGLFPVLVALRQWGEEFSFRPNEDFSKLIDRKNGKPLRKLEIRAEDGRVLDLTDTMVHLARAPA
jgi:DNA-binding HxlR family transcriptional regulator